MEVRMRCTLVLLGSVLAMAVSLRASDILMKDGNVYSNVTIVRRDASAIEIRTPYGVVSLPMATVDLIDGQLVTRPAVATPKPAAAPAATPSATATATAATASPPPSGASAAPSGAKTVAPVSVAAQEIEPGLPVNTVAWIVAALAILGAVACARVLWRRQQRKKRPKDETIAPLPFIFLDENQQPISIDEGFEPSGIENARDVLTYALHDRASDVHIEPSGPEYRVRFRVDGWMQPRMKFSNDSGIRLVTAIKSLAQIDIADRRKAQDGRFGAQCSGHEVDFRVATTPSVFGEKLVLRILDRKAGPRGLDALGMTREMMAQFAQTIHSRHGIILVTGPTGSGKTSTLYAALTQLDAQRLNLVTIEDPVEYQLDGATQIPVNARAGVTYESGLRSILRQDPDVILVGEMRDLEAAQIALRSALTGHLVFSSLHTKDAIGTVMRLEEMGIDRPLVATALFVVLAQRLVRVLCEGCRSPYPCVGDELAGVGIDLPAGKMIYRPHGCERCAGSGYLGRTGVFEMLIFDDDLRAAVNAGVAENELLRLARAKGYRGYREDAAGKVVAGITSVDEVLQAI